MTINASEMNFRDIYQVKEKLKKTIISGVKGIKQILIVKKNNDFVTMTFGTNLKKYLKLKKLLQKNWFQMIYTRLQLSSVSRQRRQLIMNEIQEVLNTQGLNIDKRHLKLISDAMTNTGEVKGVTRIGIIAQKSSILARATFETPVKQFVNATIKGNKDYLSSVVENVILNQPVPVGTGLPGLLVKVVGPLVRKEADKKRADAKIVEGVNK